MVVIGNGSDSKSEILGSSPSTPTNINSMNKNELKECTNCPGIYFIKNKINNKYYIGQAINIKKRLLKHLSNFQAKKYDNPLYRAFDKYGLDNFECGIIKEFEGNDFALIKKELDALEIQFIQEYKSYGDTGYNQTVGGDGGILGYKMTEEQKEKVSKNSKIMNEDGRNTIWVYDIEKKTYSMFITPEYASKYFDIKASTLRSAIRYKICHKKYIVERTEILLREKVKNILD